MLLTLLKLHAFHLHEEDFVAIFELVLRVWQQLNEGLVLVDLNVLDHDILEILPVLI
jgi:hypothetical protein